MMTMGLAVSVVQDALQMVLTLALPLLLVSLLLGLSVSIFQAATSINEQTLTFIPKVVGIVIMLSTIGPWMLTNLIEFFYYMVDLMQRL